MKPTPWPLLALGFLWWTAGIPHLGSQEIFSPYQQVSILEKKSADQGGSLDSQDLGTLQKLLLDRQLEDFPGLEIRIRSLLWLQKAAAGFPQTELQEPPAPYPDPVPVQGAKAWFLGLGFGTTLLGLGAHWGSVMLDNPEVSPSLRWASWSGAGLGVLLTLIGAFSGGGP